MTNEDKCAQGALGDSQKFDIWIEELRASFYFSHDGEKFLNKEEEFAEMKEILENELWERDEDEIYTE